MFDFEKLDVYKLALEFHQDTERILKEIPKNEYVLIDQLKRAALSIPLNIAEGSGRWHDKERKQYCYTSRGSVFECVPLLAILHSKELITEKIHSELREKLTRLTQMLTKLAQSFDRAQ